tara:strand:- start:79 stop:591 length:513 start_codon:yes stop_codon:yes gene_type:complete
MKELIRKILREQTENTVLVVFGGIRSATAEWMLDQIPEWIKNSRTIIAKEWDSDVSKVLLDEEGNAIEYGRLEVTGFSAGGYNVFKLANAKKPDFVGLIDPSVPEGWSLNGFPTTSTLFYDNSNWTGDNVKGIKARQPLLEAEMLEKGMKVVEENLNHMDFPKIFFENYM